MAKQNRDVSHQLDQLGAAEVANFFNPGAAVCSVFGVDPNLDQSMIVEGEIDRPRHGVGHAGGADDDHGLELVGTGAKPTPGSRIECRRSDQVQLLAGNRWKFTFVIVA